MTQQEVPEKVSSPSLAHEPRISVARIDALCDQLKNDRIAVSKAEIDLSQSKATIEKAKAEIVGQGYADGTIDGSNKQTRDAQEAKLLADSERLAQARFAVREREIALAEYRGQLAATEERISLYRAFLYSTARMPR